MINYTTPTISLTVEGVDISTADIYASFEQGRTEMTKSGTDITVTTDTHDQITDTIVTMTLTQTESALFAFNKPVSVQVNWIFANGSRDATEIKVIPVMRNLLDEVIAYGS